MQYSCSTQQRKILIVLYTSKTHGQESGPQEIKISGLPTSDNEKGIFCPFKLVLSYMHLRGDYSSDDEQFFTFANKFPVKATHLRNFLRTLLEKVNPDSWLNDVHSFRIGRTSDLA